MQYEERASAKKYVYMKQRIAKAHRSARFVGLSYLLATLVLFACTCLSLVSGLNAEYTVEKLSVFHFWEAFKEIKNFRFVAIPILSAGLYGLTLLVLLCNSSRSFSKLSWLFKRKASRVYGFNRNAYAMDDLGNAFSSSFTCILVNHFLIMLLNNHFFQIQTLFWVCVGVGLAVHLLCGVLSGRVSLFDIQSGIVEDERQVGSISPLVRNICQIACTALASWYLLKQTDIALTVQAFIVDFNGTLTILKQDLYEILRFATETALILLLVGMTSYAFSRKEYDMDGRETPGRKIFLVLSFLATGVAVFYYAYFQSTHAVAKEVLMIVVFLSVALALDLCLTAFPRYKRKYRGDEVDGDEYLYQSQKR